MKIKRNFEKKAILLGVLLIVTCLLQTTHAENSSDFDFSISIENDKLTLQVGGSSTSMISINLTSNTSENVTLQGEWT